MWSDISNANMSWIQPLIDRLLRLRNRHFLAFDAVCLLFSPLAAHLLMNGFDITGRAEFTAILALGLVFLCPKIIGFRISHLYSRYWKYASIDELARIILAVVAVSIVNAFVYYFGALYTPWWPYGFSGSIPVLDGVVTLLVVGGSRYSVRLVQRLRERMWNGERANPTLIVGAGEAGVRVAKEMQADPDLGLYPVGFVDDDEEKYGSRIAGIDVLGGRERIPTLVRRRGIAEVVIARPNAPGAEIREIVEICEEVDVVTRTIPSFSFLLNREIKGEPIREVRIDDLLRRDVVDLDVRDVADYIFRKVALITGAGGSIGGELVRQIIGYQPEKLILLGRGENSLYHLYKELQEQEVDIAIELVVCDVRDKDRVDYIFDKYRPDVVFHTAAHKHVPLMEKNPPEAIENNIFGTLNVARWARKLGVEKFVNISTDKAVNPTSIMGASKRLAEFAVNFVAQRARPHQSFVSVRFGNVLGSRGSVVPLFKKQIREGGPVTVTHPEMKRFFMTIPEAAQLVLQAGGIGENGNVYVLDMGEPVKIVDLAEDLIRLSGLQPGEDVEIEFIGTRAGEKLEEDLFAEDEVPRRTEKESLLVASNGGLKNNELEEYLTAVFVEENSRDKVVNIIALIDQLITSYNPSKEVKEYVHSRIARQVNTPEGKLLDL